MGISQGGQGRGSLFTEINITPLTDIFLVLLIIMMVIAPMFQNTNQKIKVPSIRSGESVEQNLITVEITNDGHFYVDGTQTDEASLQSKLQAQAEKTHLKQLVVRADKATHSSEVLKVFESASKAGYEKLTIAGEPLSSSRQKQLNDQNQTQQQTGESKETAQ